MLESIKISGFRKYKELSLNNLGRINCVLGSNNIGKTSILEAVYTWACGQNVIPILAGPMSRGRYPGIQNPYWMMEELLTLFNERHVVPLKMVFDGVIDGKRNCFNHTIYPSEILTDYDASFRNFSDRLITSQTNEKLPMSLQALIPFASIPAEVRTFAKWDVDINGADTQTYNLTVPILQATQKQSLFLAKFIDVLSHVTVAENVQIYGALKREKLLNTFIEEIKTVFPEIAGFDMIPYPDGSQAAVCIVKHDEEMLPIYAYGDGIQKWFYILGSMVLYRNSIICIDEVDTGFHPAAQEKFCANLIEAAKRNNVQIFMTTHNLEFIDNLLKASAKIDDKDSLRIITLRENKNKQITREENDSKIFTRVLDASEASEARNEFSIDLR